MEGVFIGNSWAFGPQNDVHDSLIVVASDSDSALLSSRSELAKPCNKICLKLWPFNPQKAQQAGAGQAATRLEPDSDGGEKPLPESEGRSR
jgi:hypothetical protein